MTTEELKTCTWPWPMTSTVIRHIFPDYLPMIALTDELVPHGPWGYFQYRAKAHSHGAYGHAMWLVSPDTFATQGWTYHTEPLDSYLGRCRIKLWYSQKWTAMQRLSLMSNITLKLNAPVTSRLYDWVGVIGQALHIPWLNIPGRFFCSESVADDLRHVFSMAIPAHPSPADLNRIFKADPDMTVYGVYDPDLLARGPV